MTSELYFDRFSKALKVGLYVVIPVVDSDNGKTRPSIIFFACLLIHLSLLVVTFVYGYEKYDELDYGSIATLASMFLAYSRAVFYQTTFLLWSNKWKILGQKIINDRGSLRNKDGFWPISLTYCKTEFLLLMMWLGTAVFCLSIASFSCFFFESNEYQLPLKYYIVWLPLNGTLLNWSLNYFYQLLTSYLASLFFYVYTPMTLLLVNQSCWSVQVLSLQVENLRSAIIEDSSASLVNDVAKGEVLREQLKKIVQTTNNVQEWQKDVQNLMKFNFLVEFSFVSLIICVCVYTVSLDVTGSVVVFLMIYCILGQLFVYCWMGSRLKAKVDNLSNAFFYVGWHLMHLEHQRDVRFVLLMLQNIKGFDGIFRTLNLRTFLKVLEFSYSLFALLRSTS